MRKGHINILYIFKTIQINIHTRKEWFCWGI